MTVDPAAITATGAASYQGPEAAPSRGSRSVAQQAVVDTLASWGARFGLAWIGLLVLAAVFAPFIASSYPLLAKEGGKLWSPAMKQLHPGDVAWLVGFFTAVGLAILRPVKFSSGFATVVWMIALTVPLTFWPVIHDGWITDASGAARKLREAGLMCAAIVDLAVLIGVPLISRAPQRYKLSIAGIGILLAILLIVFPVRPPETNVFEEYRQKAGKIEWMLKAPIPYSANDYQRDVENARLQPPSIKHLMGTEQSGADVFARMLHACRIALSVGFIATGISVLIGIVVGGLMGYFVGIVDITGMRLIEIFEAVPTLILLLTVSAFFGRNLYLMMTIIGLLGWTGYARFIRADFLSLRKQDFVQAAIAAGLPLRSIIFRHMLPNGITAVLVNTSFGVASAILIESTLSFLGLGLVDEPSWGQLLNQARAGGTGFQWWIATFPGMAIFMTVFAYNLIGEAIRDAIDPRLRKRD